MKASPCSFDEKNFVVFDWIVLVLPAVIRYIAKKNFKKIEHFPSFKIFLGIGAKKLRQSLVFINVATYFYRYFCFSTVKVKRNQCVVI